MTERRLRSPSFDAWCRSARLTPTAALRRAWQAGDDPLEYRGLRQESHAVVTSEDLLSPTLLKRIKR